MAQVQKQIRLPMSKAVPIAWKSLRVRAGRSVLTLVTIMMAIAFLSQVWTARQSESAFRSAGVSATATTASGTAPVTERGGIARTIWLVSLSLLVCLVGIANAMLMSVMERFREIGTMKCLGALDGFILRLFLLESLFLGVAGTIGGAIAGTGLTVLLLWRRHGSEAWRWMPWGTLGRIAGVSVLIGLAITAAAALYPAWRAARMEPVEAMRAEL